MANRKGTEKLAAVLQKRIKNTGKYQIPVYLELGKITAKRGLKLDNFAATIPAGDYMVCSTVEIKAGSRVLVGWASGEPVVIDTVS